MKRLLFLLTIALSLVVNAQAPGNAENPPEGKITNAIADSCVNNQVQPSGEAYHAMVSEHTGTQSISGQKSPQDAEQAFLNPAHDARPLMIWEWMDGMVNKEGITASLEAYKEAGLGGVQQFLVGGDMQTMVRDTTNAVGTENWRRQMAFAIEECKRLGLSFGTHNCPGWSSSAYPAVRPEYSMQKVVWTITPAFTPMAEGGKKNVSKTKIPQAIILPKPEVDTLYNYYEDIAVVAIPDCDSVAVDDVIVLKDKLSADGSLHWTVPEGAWRIYRFGHTTNGKQNISTAPYGGVGLECDKMSRDAVEHYWSTYPAMLLELAGSEAGKTFQRLEIDSYEAGGQDWSPVLPEEFQKRCQYDILPWLPVLAGVTIGGEEATKQFRRHWQNTVQDLFAENYYGYMSELARRHGIRLMVQPYSTGAAQPFNPINTDKIVRRIAADDPVCAEFWTKPNWGWKDVPRVVNAARNGGHEIVYAEGFTCWPFHAWKDDPDDLKRVADRSFCLGINALMLHAGALNPWTHHKPGMTFGKWGTQWTPGQTWWQSGGAKALIDYMTRCQALLQRGRFVDDFSSNAQSLSVEMDGESPAVDAKALQWTHRRDSEADIYFIANTSGAAVSPQITISAAGRVPEIWNPQMLTICDAGSWSMADGKTTVHLDMNAGDALFLVFRKKTEATQSEPTVNMYPMQGKEIPLTAAWTVTFPDEDVPTLTLDTLSSWHESEIDEVKYFSGTATYTTTIRLKKLDKQARYILDLGTVKNLAKVSVNGCEVANLWRPPFSCDISEALKKGENHIEIAVTNLWVNRLVGDEQQPDDIEWAEDYMYQSGPKAKPQAIGKFMKTVPDWLRNNQPRPSKKRKTVVSFKFFDKDAELLPSGLLGPVVLQQYVRDKKGAKQ